MIRYLRSICLSAFALLVCMAAVALSEADAVQPEPPALADPQERYPLYGSVSDESGAEIFALIDLMNDETRAAEAGGAIVVRIDQMDARGAIAETTYTFLFLSPWGRVQVHTFAPDASGYAVWLIGDCAYNVVDGALWGVGENDPDESDAAWSSYLFPFDALSALCGMRTDSNGFACYLARTESDRLIEYVTRADMTLAALRLYERDEAGTYRLSLQATHSAAESPRMPEALSEALASRGEEGQ